MDFLEALEKAKKSKDELKEFASQIEMFGLQELKI